MVSSFVHRYGVPYIGRSGKNYTKTNCVFQQSFTQATGLNDFQLNETSSSNQSTGALSDFPTAVAHEPTPSTLVAQTASSGRTVEATSLSPLSSVSQGTK